MKFEEAIQFKKGLSSETFTESGMTFFIFVTPSNHEDFLKYLTEIRGFFGRLTDEDSILYSSDGQYVINGLWCDGAHIVHKLLKN